MDLNKTLISYISNENWKKSLLLNGDWGVGKTFFVKKFFQTTDSVIFKNHSHYCFINGYDITETFDLKKYIANNSYLIGTSDLDPLLTGIVSRLSHNYSKLPPFIKSSISALDEGVKATAETTGVKLEISSIISKFVENNMEYVYKSQKIKKCILVIDELDRNSVTDIKVIFTKIIDLLENFGLKIILVSNLKSLTSNSNDFNLWSEKVIDFTIKFEQQTNNLPCLTYFSDNFRNYFSMNKRCFSNYRSYERYLVFEKVIEDKYKEHYKRKFRSDILNEFKECIFYTIFLNDNPTLFKKSIDVNNDDKRADFLNYEYSEIVENFVSLDYDSLYLKIDELFKTEKSPEKILENNYKIYIKSKQTLHKSFTSDAVENPAKYIFDVINLNINDLILLKENDTTNYKDYNYLSYWSNELKLYKEEKYISKIPDFEGRFFRMLRFKFDSRPVPLKTPSDKVKFINMDIESQILPYMKDYGENKPFIKHIRNKLELEKQEIHKTIIYDFEMEDDLEVLEYYSTNIPHFIERVFYNSDDHIRDFKSIKSHIPEWYDTAIKDFFDKSTKIDGWTKLFFLNEI